MIPSILRRDGFIVLAVLKRLASLVLIWSQGGARFWGLAGRFQTPKQSPGQINATQLHTIDAIVRNSVQLSCIVFQLFNKIQFRPYGTQ